MKKNNFWEKAGKIFFAVCCMALALIFWFIIKYNELGGTPIGF